MVGINIKAITFQVTLMKRETKNRFLAVAVRISGKITKRRAQIAYNHEEEKAFQSNQPPAPTAFFMRCGAAFLAGPSHRGSSPSWPGPSYSMMQ